jgi:hypothetical protein
MWFAVKSRGRSKNLNTRTQSDHLARTILKQLLKTKKMAQPVKVFSRAWLEQASSRYKAVLYSLALFRLSYPEGFLSVGIPISPSPVARQWSLQLKVVEETEVRIPREAIEFWKFLEQPRSLQDDVWQKKTNQGTKGFSRAWIEQASSRYKAMLYSLALFRLSYPEGSLFGVYSLSLAGGQCGWQ